MFTEIGYKARRVSFNLCLCPYFYFRERYISYLEDFALFSQPKLIGGAKHVPLLAGNVVRSKLIFFQF